jgi:hypothetical protein
MMRRLSVSASRGMQRLQNSTAARNTRSIRSSSSSSISDGRTRVVYVTDCEGNLDYLLDCIHLVSSAHPSVIWTERCDAAAPTADGALGRVRLQLGGDTHFVFGGDAVDHGGADLRVLSVLLDLKRRHPTRTHFILGNRDVNKMRLTAELHAADLRRDPADIPTPYWQHPRQQVPLSRFLAGTSAAAAVEAPWQQQAEDAARLRWLAHSQRLVWGTLRSD